MICSGQTSNLAFTPLRSSVVLLMVFTSVMRASTSCAMSLSPVEISTGWPCAAARQASVPITSSASTPAMRSIGSPSAVTAASKRFDLAAQVIGHGRAMRLVLGKQLIAEGLSRCVEHHDHGAVSLFAHELLQHVEHAVHGAGGFAARVGQRRQREECAIEIRRAVDQYERGRAHSVDSVAAGGFVLVGSGASCRSGQGRCARYRRGNGCGCGNWRHVLAIFTRQVKRTPLSAGRQQCAGKKNDESIAHGSSQDDDRTLVAECDPAFATR